MLAFPEVVPPGFHHMQTSIENTLPKKKISLAAYWLPPKAPWNTDLTGPKHNRSCFGTAGAPKHRSLKPATVPGLVCSSTLPGDEPHMCGGQLFFFSVWFVVRWLVLRKNLIQGALKTSKTDKPKVFSLGNNEMRCTSSKMSFPLSRIQGLDRSLYYSSLLLCQKANFFIAKICLSQVSKFLGRE